MELKEAIEQLKSISNSDWTCDEQESESLSLAIKVLERVDKETITKIIYKALNDDCLSEPEDLAEAIVKELCR